MDVPEEQDPVRLSRRHHQGDRVHPVALGVGHQLRDVPPVLPVDVEQRCGRHAQDQHGHRGQALRTQRVADAPDSLRKAPLPAQPSPALDPGAHRASFHQGPSA